MNIERITKSIQLTKTYVLSVSLFAIIIAPTIQGSVLNKILTIEITFQKNNF